MSQAAIVLKDKRNLCLLATEHWTKSKSKPHIFFKVVLNIKGILFSGSVLTAKTRKRSYKNNFFATFDSISL